MFFDKIFSTKGPKKDTPEQPSDVAPVRRAKKSRTVSDKRRTRRPVHTQKSFYAPKRRPVKEQVRVFDTITRPVVTEKVAGLSEKGVYAFFVRRASTKHSVADAVEALYGVRPMRVRIAKSPAKRRRLRVRGRERGYGYTAERKKAYVFLKKGDTIQLT